MPAESNGSREGAAGRAAEDIREELRVVEAELVELRSTVAGLREQIGERSDGVTDAAEHAATLTAMEEQEALIGILSGRGSELRQQLAAG